jgi:uncharacterized damage-inducible protein DinB
MESNKTTEVQELIVRLQQQMNRAVEVFADVDGAQKSDHVCAMQGTLNDLLAHNTEHEKMHAGQVSDRRYALGLLQRDPRQRYLAEWYRERAMLIALLLDLPDDALDKETEPGVTTIRQIIEHVLYWDKGSVEHTAVQKAEGLTRGGVYSGGQ